MFDRSVKPIPLKMKIDSFDNVPVFDVPEGYGFRCFQKGDEYEWARIEMSAGEFDSIEDGLKGFYKYYPTDDGLDTRMFFLTDNGVPCATSTAWFTNDTEGQLHWVSVEASHQGRGLCRPIVSLSMQKMKELGYKSAILTTQTESWVAIKVYYQFGFRPAPRTENDDEGWKIVSEKTGIEMKLAPAEE